ncbi:MAG: hypothetical protein GY794_10320, partial [bacterium]|nr:hypothetical protein [bacterium]
MKQICLKTVVLTAMVLVSGCARIQKDLGEMFATDTWRFMDPSKTIAPQEGEVVKPIYSSSSDADITEELPPNATPPTAADLTYSDRDYLIGPTDILDVSILDLLENGIETVLRREVTASGYIDLPLLPDRVKAEGKSKEQLTELVKEMYVSGSILKSPTVAVTVAARRQSTCSVLGAVTAPGTYQIDRKDMRLLNILAAARGITQQNIKYLYVIRPAPAKVMNPKTGKGDKDKA